MALMIRSLERHPAFDCLRQVLMLLRERLLLILPQLFRRCSVLRRRQHSIRVGENKERSLLPKLLPNTVVQAGKETDRERSAIEIFQQIELVRDARGEGDTAEVEFQDRCLKPLGRPSSTVGRQAVTSAHDFFALCYP
jgi:hypothetical protein